MTKFSKWILYVSSYIPLYIVFIVNSSFGLYYVYLKSGYDFTSIFLDINFYVIVFFILMSVISWWLLSLIININTRSQSIKDFVNIKKNNSKISEYILVYILPFIGFDCSDLKSLIIFSMVFFIIGSILVNNNLMYINPILYFKKYNIFESEEKIVLSKFSIIEMKRKGSWDDVNNKLSIRASEISRGVYIIK